MDYMIFHHSILNTSTFCLTKYKEGTVLSALAQHVGTGHCLKTVQFDHQSSGNWSVLTVVRILVDSGMAVSLTGKELN